MKNSQQRTTIPGVWNRCLLVSGFLVLVLLAPLANAEKSDDKKSSEASSDASDSKSGSTGAGESTNTIVIGGSAGSMSVNSAAGTTAISTIVIQEQTVASPYNYR